MNLICYLLEFYGLYLKKEAIELTSRLVSNSRHNKLVRLSFLCTFAKWSECINYLVFSSRPKSLWSLYFLVLDKIKWLHINLLYQHEKWRRYILDTYFWYMRISNWLSRKMLFYCERQMTSFLKAKSNYREYFTNQPVFISEPVFKFDFPWQIVNFKFVKIHMLNFKTYES